MINNGQMNTLFKHIFYKSIPSQSKLSPATMREENGCEEFNTEFNTAICPIEDKVLNSVKQSLGNSMNIPRMQMMRFKQRYNV